MVAISPLSPYQGGFHTFDVTKHLSLFLEVLATETPQLRIKTGSTNLNSYP